MGKFDQFNYWRNGVTITKTPIKKIPYGGTEHLLFYQIHNGEFDESPYWKMSEDELLKFDLEIVEWKERNPRSNKLAFEDWHLNRRKVYNKKIQKLREEHQKYEVSRLQKFKDRIEQTFSSLKNIEMEGTMLEIYTKCKERRTE